MLSTKKRFLQIAIGAIAVALVATGYAQAVVKIGVPLALSGSGAFAGTKMQQAMKVAFEQLNSQHKDIQLQPIWKDTRTDQGTGIDVTTELAQQDNVAAIVGYTASNICQAAIPVAQQSKVPVLDADCVVPGLTKIGNYVFRDVVSYDNFVSSMIDTLSKAMGWKTGAIIYLTQNPVFDSEKVSISQAFKRDGIKLVATESVPSGNDSDFAAQLTRIAAKKPDVLGVMLLGGQSGPASVQVRQAGMTNTALIGEMNLNSNAYRTTGGKDAIGTYYPAHWTILAHFPRNDAYIKAYEQRWNEPPDIFATNGYQAVETLAQAIYKAGAPSNYANLQAYRAAVRDALDNLGTIDTVFGNGTMKMVNRKVVLTAHILHVVANGSGGTKVELYQ